MFISVPLVNVYLVSLVSDSDANWWKGTNNREEGLFPANFVTADLTAEPETSEDAHIPVMGLYIEQNLTRDVNFHVAMIGRATKISCPRRPKSE